VNDREDDQANCEFGFLGIAAFGAKGHGLALSELAQRPVNRGSARSTLETGPALELTPEVASSRSGEAQSEKRFYAPELDFLRFGAFFAVFVFHALHTGRQYVEFSYRLNKVIAAAIGAGAFGVDLFFVLSAYLITELLLREKQITGDVKVPAFYLRRILRIWPLYFFFLGIAALLPLFTSSQRFGWKYLAGYCLLSGNWMTVLLGVPLSVANPLWSVSMEEQFYLCWAPLVRRLSTKGITVTAAILLITSSLTRSLQYVFVHPLNQSVWFNTFARLDPIALGILLAVLLRVKRISVSRSQRVLLFFISSIGLLFVSAYCNLSGNSESFSVLGLIGYPIVALSCLGILFATLGIRFRRGRNPGLIYLGKISYGLYIYHLLALWLIGSLFQHLPGPPNLRFGFTAALCLTIVLAAVSYHVLELPFLRFKKRFTYVQSRPL
jgi:peptidoglycan/LPS O-acetylase OafA/YrhL